MTKASKISRNARNIEFDIIKGLAIFLMVCGHSIMHLSSEQYSQNILFVFIYSFHMPLFMLVSGFFAARSLELPFNSLLTKKFWQLIYPTLSFGIIFLIIDLIFWDSLTSEKIYNVIFGIWFLKSCFLCFLVLFLCLKLTGRHIILGCVVALIVSQGLPFYKLTYMLPFFIFGFLLSRNKERIYENTGIKFIVYTIVFAGVFLWYKNNSLNEFPLMEVKDAIFAGNMGVINSYAIFQLTRLILGFTGSMMVISLVILITRKLKHLSDPLLFSIYGKYTLGIYVLQSFILEDLMARYIDLDKINLLFFDFVVVPLISYLIMDFCYHIVLQLEKYGLKKILFEGFSKSKEIIEPVKL